MIALMLAVQILFAQDWGETKVEVSAESEKIDLARSTFVTISVKGAPSPDLRERFVGFSLAEDYEVEPGITKWRLEPRPGEKAYKLLPFAVGEHTTKSISFIAPDPLPSVSGEMEIKCKKDFSFADKRLIGKISIIVLTMAAFIAALFFAFRWMTRKVKEHFMSPIERAMVELERLLKKELVRKGLFKDFYVELTLVVRRYIQRKYDIKAPHMTTEEFLACAKPSDELREFLESADLIKFAGVKASEETAAKATEKARNYLKTSEARK